jgi:hypothetical protein
VTPIGAQPIPDAFEQVELTRFAEPMEQGVPQVVSLGPQFKAPDALIASLFEPE